MKTWGAGRFFTQVRVNVHYADWNAAGSYFAMTLLMAAALVARRRWGYVVAVILIGTALWLTGSRTAFVAVLVTAGLAALLAVRRSDIRRNAALAVGLVFVIAVAAAGWLWYPSHRNDPAAYSLRTRLELSRVGIRMIATQPISESVSDSIMCSNEYAGQMLVTFGG